MSENLLNNGGFEIPWGDDKSHRVLVFPDGKDPYEAEVGEIFTPSGGWIAFFRHVVGTWDQPEVTHMHKSQYPRRVCEGKKAIKLFTFHKRHDAGLMQQVAVEPGVRLKLSAMAHAWSNHNDLDGYEWCADDGLCSAGVGQEIAFISEGEAPELCGDPWSDAIQNFTFRLGVDPTGGTNPYADTVVWGWGAHIYNEFAPVPEVEVVAEAEMVTVFLHSKTLFAFRHNDAYWDDVELTVEGETPPPPPPGGTKLGAHNIRGGSPTFLEAGAAISLAIEDWGDTFLAPDNILKMGAVPTVGYDAQAMYYDMQLSPADAAAKFIADCRDTMEWNGWCKYWLGHNEPVWEIDGQINHAGMAWYAEFEIERMKQLKALVITARNGEQFGPSHYKAVVGNFSCGYPPFDLWPSFYPALAVLRKYEGLLGLHEYSWGWMWWLTGSYQPDGLAPLPEDHGWLTCRWKMLRDQFLAPEGLGDVPIVITECGLDGGISPKPPMYEDVGGAWKSLVDKWEAREGIPDGQEYYAQQLEWYDAKLRADPYVVGATIFTFGAHAGTPWERFDLSNTEALEHLMAYAAQNPTTGFVYPPPGELPPPPPPPPPPPDGLPREQYERTYVLLPPGTGTEWAHAVIDGSWEARRFTVGGSADDAGVAALYYKRVIAVNPAAWGDDLGAFFEEYYPGVIYVEIEAATPEELTAKLMEL